MENISILTEWHHANILTAFFDGLTEGLGEEAGKEAFLTCERFYGSRRGRRMAMRALRDGNPLDFTSYFAYGELLTTPGGYEGTYKAEKGLIHETQWKCPWASAFGSCEGMGCAHVYCTEIDAAIVRGFNPALDFTYGQNMHASGTCEFYFRGDELNESSLETCNERLKDGRSEKRDMNYHTGDVYQMFTSVVSMIAPGLLAGILEDIRARVGDEAFALLEELRLENYETI